MLSIYVSAGSNPKAKLATRCLFSLAHKHGDILREGWKNVLEILLQLFRCELLPKSLMEAEDYVDAAGRWETCSFVKIKAIWFTCDWKTVFGISYESFCWFVIIGKICPQLFSLRCSFLRATDFQWHPGSYGSFWFLKKVFTVEPFCQLNPRVFIFLELCSLSPHKWVLPYSIPAPVRDA